MNRAYSFGGGVQSTAMLVLAAEGKIARGPMLFSNVGDNSEHPAVFDYIREHSRPYAEKHDIDLRELAWVDRTGRKRRLLDELLEQKKSVPIPVRMAGGGAPGRRRCTDRYKITVVARELRRLGATKEAPWELGIGISLDEYQRMRTDTRNPRYVFSYPLIELEVTRQDALNIIGKAGLPTPPRSACWFCPLHSAAEWEAMARNEPELFAASVELESTLNDHRVEMGKDHVYFSSRLAPLGETVNTEQLTLTANDDGDNCDSGFCFT